MRKPNFPAAGLSIFLWVLGATSAAAQTAPAQAQPSQTQLSPAQIVAQNKLEDAKFAAFVKDFRDTAIKAGISSATYDRSMAGISRNPRIEDLNLNQPEFSRPVWEYLDSAVSADRVSHGQTMMAANAPALAHIESRFSVPKEILVAIWGMESNYGEAMGSFNMFEALATLAYDGPRADYARKELIAALKMEEQEHLDPTKMTSSWAGAFGHTQFIPSAFLAHAVDGDGDGKRDLWHSPADALASTASLLADAGWHMGDSWGYEIALPKDFPYEEADVDNVKTLAQWRKLGVTKISGTELPHGEATAGIYLPAGAHGPAFLVFDNFKTVLKYNNAASYALAVCYLADRIAGGAPIVASWPRDEIPLSRDERLAFQADLKKLGFDPGDIDGVLGHKGRAALRAYQKARGLAPDGFATENLLERMERDIVAKGG
ncbi:MAG: lytic murein transglycosylase [Rhizomicrobium sp.]